MSWASQPVKPLYVHTTSQIQVRTCIHIEGVSLALAVTSYPVSLWPETMQFPEKYSTYVRTYVFVLSLADEKQPTGRAEMIVVLSATHIRRVHHAIHVAWSCLPSSK